MHSNKSALISELTAQRDEILAVCDGMSEAARTAVITPEGWNTQDFIGHLAFWESTTLDHLTQTFKEGRPQPMLPVELDNDLNGREMAKRKTWTWERVRAAFVNARNALIQRVEGLSETDLEFQVPSPWINDERIYTLESLIREDALGHGQEHLADIKRAHDHR